MALLTEKIAIYNEEDFKKMRIAGRLAAEVLDYIEQYIVPGVTTLELDVICHDMIVKRGAIPACLGYNGFPKTICTSVNHVVCHGIPGPQKLSDGDIINIDVTVIVDGFYGDTSRMYAVGESFNRKSPHLIKAKKLVDVTYRAMMLGIAEVAPGKKLSSIGKAIQDVVHPAGFSIVRDYCGHGTGKKFHVAPNILHYFDPHSKEAEIIMKPGMIFTVEPMINAGDWRITLSPIDKWTVTTKDNSLSAQFEHTIGVTESGYEIFTLSPSGRHAPSFVNIL